MDEKIDISPLFETEKGLSTGHEVIASLLKNVHYKKYVTKRKKLSVQTDILMLEDILVSQQRFANRKSPKKDSQIHQIIIYQM